MIDTNILISVLFPKGRAAETLYKALVSLISLLYAIT